MVFQKKMDTGFIGCKIPTMPRFPRSARGKRSRPKKLGNNEMHPFDLLAAVAGEILSKRESSCSIHENAEAISPLNKIKREQIGDASLSKSEVFDQGSCDESSFVARFGSHEERGAASALALVKSGLKCESQKLKATGCFTTKEAIEFHNSKDPMHLDDAKAPAVVSSDSSVEIPPNASHHSALSSSFHSAVDCMEQIVDRDDDENSSGRTSNYWKLDREAMNDGEIWHCDEEIKRVLRPRKLCYTRQRSHRSSFKKRMFSEHCSFSASNGGFCGQGAAGSPLKDNIKLISSDPHSDINGAAGRSCSTTGQRLSYESADNTVKLSIKSFMVPELFVDIPANSTVGSLKSAVTEAVAAILYGELRIGVLLHGNKVRDDNKTLRQAGISGTAVIDNLGFVLEPNLARTPPPRDSHSSEPEPIKNNPTHSSDQAISDRTAAQLLPNTTLNWTESNYDLAQPSSADEICNDSKALVPKALAVVPLRSSRRSEMVQRRIRRPFSVTEVEALVMAVEKLGTGRWRDVKLRAFDNMKHRTYVDLKVINCPTQLYFEL